MWFTALISAALLGLFSTPAIAQEPIGKAAVAIAMTGEDLLVTITLDRPVTRLELDQADVVRDDAIKPVSAGQTFSDNAFTSAVPFDTAVFRVVQDIKERDAKYPAYYRIGEGRLLYAQAVYPDQRVWQTTLTTPDMPAGWTRWPEADLPQGYLFLGPKAMVMQENGVRFVFDGNGDAAFEAGIRENVSRALLHLTETFGSPPAEPPFVATSLLRADDATYTGDVTNSAMIALRFFAPDAVSQGSRAGARHDPDVVRKLILHEGVHFWNGGRAQFRPDTPQWLHEGGAEYLATLGSWQLGWSTREDLEQAFSEWFDRCSTSLSYSDEPALNDLEFINASIRYSCGPLLHALAELYLAEAGAGQTITSGWRETVRAAEAADGRYGLPEFAKALGHPDLMDRPALAAILSTSGEARWAVVTNEMRRLGVNLELEASPQSRARKALIHLIRLQCTGLKPGESFGFFSGATSYKLDTPAGCGILAGGPEVETLAGSRVTNLTAGDYERLQSACAMGQTVIFGMRGGTEIPVPCTAPLDPASTQPRISLPDIPAFARSAP